MYSLGSEECLKNAERLLNDAQILLDKGSLGSAQTLSVTAYEEISKSIILEFANLNFAEKKVVEESMKNHDLKKALMLAIEKGSL